MSTLLPLSGREREVLDLFDQGLSYKEIADRLQISPHTVRTHAREVIVKTLALSLRHAAYLRRPPSQTDHTPASSPDDPLPDRSCRHAART
jgi:DNA-binding CsgD family transcriptional regulator